METLVVVLVQDTEGLLLLLAMAAMVFQVVAVVFQLCLVVKQTRQEMAAMV
jgi:hypothetical protein